MRLGVTGHQTLQDPKGWTWVEERLVELLRTVPRPIVGVTSLAIGADQLFARLVLQFGGTLHVVIPFSGYERTFKNPHDLQTYRSLLGAADKIETVSPERSDEQAFLAAGKRVVDLSDAIIAIWDGEAARGLGGTGDVVGIAKQKQIRVIHLNPVTHQIS